MKANEMRLAKLEKHYEQSPIGVMKEVMGYLSQDLKFWAAINRMVLASTTIDVANPEAHRWVLASLNEPEELQPDDQDVFDEAFMNLPDEYKEKLRAVGIEV